MIGRWDETAKIQHWHEVPWDKLTQKDRDTIKELPDWAIYLAAVLCSFAIAYDANDTRVDPNQNRFLLEEFVCPPTSKP